MLERHEMCCFHSHDCLLSTSRYPEKWYLDVTSSTRFYSLAAVDPQAGSIIGFIVCDIKSLAQVNSEVCNMYSEVRINNLA